MKSEYLDIYSSALAHQIIRALEKLKVPVGEDLDRLASLLKKQLQPTSVNPPDETKLAKRLRIVEGFRKSRPGRSG